VCLCLQVLERLHQSCRNFDGTDNQKEHSSELIDIYATRVRLLARVVECWFLMLTP
jgi:hypothetical protein